MPSIDLDLDTPIHEMRPEGDVISPLPEVSSPDVFLNDLQAQVRIIGKMKPSLSELAARYQQRKSRIDQFVEWYANQPLWGKVLAGGVVGLTSYMLGAFAGVAWLLMGLLTALYAAAILIVVGNSKIV